MKPIYHIHEVPAGIDFKQIPVADSQQAQEILETGEYTVGWYYRPNSLVKWLIVRKEEYNRNQY